MNERFHFETNLKVSEQCVTVDFRIVNLIASDLYVVDCGFKVNKGALEFLEFPMACSIDQSTATLTSQLVDLNSDVARATAPSAWVRKLDSKEYRGSLSHPIPLIRTTHRERYRSDESLIEPDTDFCTRLQFRIGVIVHSDDLDPQPFEIDGTEIFRLGAAAWKRQYVLQSSFDRIKLPMRGYDLLPSR